MTPTTVPVVIALSWQRWLLFCPSATQNCRHFRARCRWSVFAIPPQTAHIMHTNGTAIIRKELSNYRVLPFASARNKCANRHSHSTRNKEMEPQKMQPSFRCALFRKKWSLFSELQETNCSSPKATVSLRNLSPFHQHRGRRCRHPHRFCLSQSQRDAFVCIERSASTALQPWRRVNFEAKAHAGRECCRALGSIVCSSPLTLPLAALPEVRNTMHKPSPPSRVPNGERRANNPFP